MLARKKDNTSWTSTIENIQKTAKKSSLLEFTATIDLNNKAIAQKYEKHLIFKYDLKEFRFGIKYFQKMFFFIWWIVTCRHVCFKLFLSVSSAKKLL